MNEEVPKDCPLGFPAALGGILREQSDLLRELDPVLLALLIERVRALHSVRKELPA